jgi:hypothetical protein
VFDCDEYVSAVLSLRPGRPYAQLGRLAAVASASPAEHREGFAALLLRKLEPLPGWSVPNALTELHFAEWDRLRNDLTQQPDAYYTATNDSMVKDLAIASGLMLGTGYSVIERSGVPRSWMVRGGPVRWPANLAAFGATRGFSDFTETHMHDRCARLSESTWTKTIYDCAELMRANPPIRGLMASSWFFDPAVASVSPHLAYLHGLPQSGGATFFDLGTSAHTVALATTASKARRALYEGGKYHPRLFGLIWPRERVLRWTGARSQAA